MKIKSEISIFSDVLLVIISPLSLVSSLEVGLMAAEDDQEVTLKKDGELVPSFSIIFSLYSFLLLVGQREVAIRGSCIP